MSPGRWAFSPETYAVATRQEAWTDVLGRLSLTWEATTSSEVAGAITVREFPGSFTAARLTAPPQIIIAASQRRATGWLALVFEGDIHVARDSRHIRLAPNDIVFGSASAITPLVVHSNAQLLFVVFAEAAIKSRMLDLTTLHDPTLAPQAVGTRVLFGLLKTLSDTLCEMPDEMGRPLEAALLEMLAQMAAGTADASPEGLRGSAMRQGTARMLQRLRATIEQRLSDPTLTIADIAAAEGTSVRYVQKLFERDGESFLHCETQ
jgi:AraC-binding-like domain